MSSSLRVMKFGGTSVGDAGCIARAAEIVKSAAAQGPVVAVVSAMSGVTNRLIQAAHGAEAGNKEIIPGLMAGLREQHTKALESLVKDGGKRKQVAQALDEVLAELER